VARLNDEGQWIILMAFIISITIFFLALIANQSTLVGKTTAEAVLDFPKNDIQDLKHEILRIREVYATDPIVNPNDFNDDIQKIAIAKKSSFLHYSIDASDPSLKTRIYFNNGITEYNEVYY
jgi:hypothetical protein